MLALFRVVTEPFRRKRHENMMKMLRAEMESIKEEPVMTTLRICPNKNDGITELVVEGDLTVKMHYQVKRFNKVESLADQKARLKEQYKGFYYLKSDGRKIDFLADVSNELKGRMCQ